jgi:co-chaperonin GroES (HSP10)
MSNQTETTSSQSTSTEVPKTRLALQEKYKEEGIEPTKKVDETNIESIADQLPEPAGYRLLVLPFTPKDKTKGGILIAQESLDRLRIATNCGYVIKIGPLAYADKEKFATGPWCKKGDWVIFARYAGSRLPIEGGEVRILNDDEVLGTIKDPEAVLHHI